MSTKLKKALKIALLVLIVFNVAFIFTQSILPPEESSKESSAVGGVIEDIIPPETKPGEFIQTNLRKIAHFVEFATLGAEVSLFVVLFVRRRIVAFLSFPTALIVGFFDETIQLFSGRGASVKDVWIDFFGFASAALIFYTGYLVAYLIRNNVNKSVHETAVK